MSAHPSRKWTEKSLMQRKGLLAKVHIAKKELGMTEDQYEAVLSGLGAKSAGELTIPKLELLIRHMKYCGWKSYRPRRKTNEERRITALQDRAIELAGCLDRGEERLAGLVKSIGGVDALPWLKDLGKLLKILKVLGTFIEKE